MHGTFAREEVGITRSKRLAPLLFITSVAGSLPLVAAAGPEALGRSLHPPGAVEQAATVFSTDESGTPEFSILDNQGDANFNQLLGISDGRIVVGYYGDGAVVANNAYVLVSPNHYAPNNFTHLAGGDSAAQTQAIGINNKAQPDIVGFYTDKMTGFTHGFVDSNGTQLTVDDPAGSPPNVASPAQNLLGINDFGKAAGFWTDKDGHLHGFLVQLNQQAPASSRFTEISPASFPGAVATQASGITNEDKVCGFWTDAKGNNHGFFGHLGHSLATFDVKIHAVTEESTSPFGCNDAGEIVGSFTDTAGFVHGFVFRHGRFTQFDAPGSSQTAAFGVSGTLINGVNERGDVVGFFSDGTQVHGFVKLGSTFREDDDQD